MLKAYRELERDGLVAARPGVGTFVTRSLADDSLAAHEPLRRDLERWLARARAAGVDDESIEALFRSAFRGEQQGRSMTAVLATDAAGQALPAAGGRCRTAPCEIPAGRVTGLVGQNGAGKSTLLNLAAGLLRADDRAPSRSAAAGRHPTPPSSPRSASSPRTPRRTPGSASRDHLRLGAHLNPRWDDALARSRVERLGLDPGQRAGRLSGGQRAQLALALGLAKRPELLILDEPVASLDPFARREFLQLLMEAVAEQELSVVLSSHVVSDLERVCDHVVVLVDSEVRLAGDVETLLDTHHRLTGPRRARHALPADQQVVSARHTDRQTHPRRAHRAPGPRPGLDRHRARPGGPRAVVHGTPAPDLPGAPGRRRPTARRPWRC